MKTAKTKKTATKKPEAKKSRSLSIAKLRRDALVHFGVDPFDHAALLFVVGKGPKPAARANVVSLAKKNGATKNGKIARAAGAPANVK